MATKGKVSPLTRLGKAIDRLILKGDALHNIGPDRMVTVRTLRRWRQWAEAPDARFRLDGSELSKQKKKPR